jgi:hypothetical protein
MHGTHVKPSAAPAARDSTPHLTVSGAVVAPGSNAGCCVGGLHWRRVRYCVVGFHRPNPLPISAAAAGHTTFPHRKSPCGGSAKLPRPLSLFTPDRGVKHHTNADAWATSRTFYAAVCPGCAWQARRSEKCACRNRTRHTRSKPAPTRKSTRPVVKWRHVS